MALINSHNGGEISCSNTLWNIQHGHFSADTVYIGNQKHKHYLHEYEVIPTLKGPFVSFYDLKILESLMELNPSE